MINLKNVSFQYEGGLQNNGLSDISLNIIKGEVVLLCGESGCGKTTLTRLINGLIPHYYSGTLSGEVKINGRDVGKISLHEISKYVGSVFQNPRSQFYCMDTNSELAFGCENQGLPVNDIERRIELTVSHLNIQDLMNRNIFNLSGGEKQKIAMQDLKKLETLELLSMNLRPLSLETLSFDYKRCDRVTEKIELSDFNYAYKGGNKALDIGSLNLPKGKIIGIIGQNGAGKSTFARCLCGLNKRFKGKVYVNSIACNHKHCLKKAYMVMQDVNHQLFTETVLDEVLLSMNDDNIEKAKAILDSLNLLDVQELHPMSLSGGQKQRVAIASAIASEREIIIFDEPTSGLDLRHMIQVSENLKKLKGMGKTIIIITHDLELILEVCTHVIQLEKGRIRDSYLLDDEGEKKILSFFTFKNDCVYNY